MHFRTLATLALPLLALSLPISRRQEETDLDILGISSVDNAGLPAAEKGAQGLGAALGQGSGSVSQSQSQSGSESQQNQGAGKQSSAQGGSNSNDNSNQNQGSQGASQTQQGGQGDGQASQQAGQGNGQASQQAGQGNGGNNQNQGNGNGNAAASSKRARPCDEGDQSLEQGLNALITVHLGAQAASKTLEQTVSAKQINQNDFKTNQQRLQQFLDTAKLQLNMANAIADDDTFAKPQLQSLAQSLQAADSVVKGLKGQASDAKQLQNLAASLRVATGVVQDGVANSVVDCFLPLTTVSG